MARKKTTKSGKTTKSRSRIDLFGPPPILVGEDEATYNELFKRVNEALKPTDIFEEFAARDIANSMMDSMRYARFKPELLKANMHTGMQRVLKPLCDLSMQIKFDRPILDADKVAAGWAMGEPNMRKIAEALLEVGGLSMDAVVAETLSYEMNGFEGMDRLATNNEARRYAHLRELERRRESKREAAAPVALRATLAALDKVKANDNEQLSKSDVVDGEYKEVETDGSSKAVERQRKAAGE